MIMREADGAILTHAGPEIGVASTKAFTSQMSALYLFGLIWASCAACFQKSRPSITRSNSRDFPSRSRFSKESDGVEELSKEFFRSTDFLYWGAASISRSHEGALKLKEISYIQPKATGGEMKHGPKALIEEPTPSSSSTRARKAIAPQRFATRRRIRILGS